MTSNDLKRDQLNMGNGRLAGTLPAHPRRGPAHRRHAKLPELLGA
jgi:hypothetical protein